ncbi:MAG: hypothetical protein ACLFRT_06670 [Actinomycetota bacterium]
MTSREGPRSSSRPPEDTDPELLEVATGIMTRRIEDFGAVQEPDIAVSGDDTVVVQLPGVEDEQRRMGSEACKVGKTLNEP